MRVAHRDVGGAEIATFFSLRGPAQSVTKFVLKFFRAAPSRKTDASGRQKSTSNQSLIGVLFSPISVTS
jgi:hypothetical protein